MYLKECTYRLLAGGVSKFTRLSGACSGKILCLDDVEGAVGKTGGDLVTRIDDGLEQPASVNLAARSGNSKEDLHEKSLAWAQVVGDCPVNVPSFASRQPRRPRRGRSSRC